MDKFEIMESGSYMDKVDLTLFGFNDETIIKRIVRNQIKSIPLIEKSAWLWLGYKQYF